MDSAQTIRFFTLLLLAIATYSEASGASPYVVQANDNEVSKSNRPSYQDYKEQRQLFLETEMQRSLGGRIRLNDREEMANEVFMKIKKADLEDGFHNPGDFTGAIHIFKALNNIESSDMFHLLKRMPKGGVLHAHDTALASTEFVMSLTYWDHLWQCHVDGTTQISLIFSRDQPTNMNDCQWVLVSEERARVGAEKYDAEMRKHFSLYTDDPEADYSNINVVWYSFGAIFGKITPMLTYYPVWKAYYKQALKEFCDDNVQFLEFRGTLPDLYDLDGRIYKNEEVIQAYIDVLEEFKAANPGFIGSKFIFAPVRQADDDTFQEYLETLCELYDKYPDFVVGFDLVSQEDLGRPLIDFAEAMLTLPDKINFYFHAGESNWNGMSTDENLIDAVLLGAKRIGHGYALTKHPNVQNMVKLKGIAIEVNPISNQVLKLLDDHRNHPAAHLFAEDYPLVISSDDPSFWEVTPLTHDFYIAFMGIASAHSDLRTLKQLAINSLQYASFNATERTDAFNKWQSAWDQYIEWVISQRSKYDL